MELAAAFFEAQLQGRAGADGARLSRRPRAFAATSSAAFRIGYAPAERYALRDHLAGKGVAAEVMIEAGLLVAGEDVPVPFDRFRDRVMFPIGDVRGRVVAFGGRAHERRRRRRNTSTRPDTPLFHKGRLLYNQHQAREPAHERGTIIAVEGYVDVIAMTMAGFAERRRAARHGADRGPARASVAHGRRADPVLRRRQGRPPRRLPGDRRRAAEPQRPASRCASRSCPTGRTRTISSARAAPAAVERVLDAARPLVDMLWARETEAGPLDTPERRAALEQRLREALGAIRDETLRRYYRDEIDARLRGAPRGRAARRSDAISAVATGPAAAANGSRPASADQAGRAGGAAREPACWQRARCSLGGARRRRRGKPSSSASRRPSGTPARARRDPERARPCRPRRERPSAASCSIARRRGEGGDPAILAARLEPGRARRGGGRACGPGRGPATAGRSIRMPIRCDLTDALRQAIILHRRARTLHSELRAAERALAEEESEANLAWLREVQNQLSSVDGAEADDRGDRRSGTGAGGAPEPTNSCAGGSFESARRSSVGAKRAQVGGTVYSQSTRLTVGSVEASMRVAGPESLAAFSRPAALRQAAGRRDERQAAWRRRRPNGKTPKATPRRSRRRTARCST